MSTGAGDMVPQRLPLPGAFDHVIVRATVDGKTLWLDGTASGSRLSDLDDVPPFRNALPVRESGADLVAMPRHANARPQTEVTIDIDQRAGIHYPAPYRLTARVRGSDAESIRLATAGASKAQADEMIDALVNRQIARMPSVVHSRRINYDEAGSALVIDAEGIVWPDWKMAGGKWTLLLDATVDGLDFTPDRARPAWRDIPVASGTPGDSSVRTTLRLPEGAFTLEGNRALPPSLGGVLLARKADLANGAVTVEDRVTTGLNEIAPADIPAERRLVAQAKGRLLKAGAPADYPAPWRGLAAAKRARAFAPLTAAFAGYVAGAPDEASRYTTRAGFFEGIYDHAAALADLDKAIELEPTPANHLWRARLRHERGDDKGAATDVLAALALDPGSAEAIRTRATQLARDGKLDDALTMLAEQIDQGGDERIWYVSTQASLLGENGRAEEGIGALDAVIAETPGNAALLNSRCWLKGTANVALDTGLRDCTRSIELSDNPAAPLDSRGLIYLRMGRLDEALADLDAALLQSPGQAASLYLRGVVLKRQGKDGSAELAAARLMSPRIDEDYARFGIRP